MKKIFILLAVFFCVYFEVQTREPAIYKTISDFNTEQNPISLICTKNKNKIKVGSFLMSPYLFFQTKDGSSKIHLDSIYGYTDYTNNSFRIWNRKAYKICDSGEIKIYCQTDWAKVKKHTSRGIRTKEERKTMYFFSRNDSSAIYSLTHQDLRKEMNVSDSFYTKLTTQFPCTISLAKTLNSHFLINQFLKDNK